ARAPGSPAAPRSTRSPRRESSFASGDLRSNPAQSDVALAEGVDHIRIELLARLVDDLVDRFPPRPVAAIGAVARDRVECVGDGEHTRAERDLVAAEPVRITGAVPPLVMR